MTIALKSNGRTTTLIHHLRALHPHQFTLHEQMIQGLANKEIVDDAWLVQNAKTTPTKGMIEASFAARPTGKPPLKRELYLRLFANFVAAEDQPFTIATSETSRASSHL